MPDPAVDAAPIASVRDLRRAQILDAARAIVATDGLEALTFGELEKRLAFTRGVVTYHFRNKDDIVHALLDDTLRGIDARARQAVRDARDPEQAVAAAIRAMVSGFLDHPDATAVLVSFWGRLRSDPRAREANAALYRGWRSNAAALVREGQERGVFRADVDPGAAGAVIVGSVIGIAGQALFEEGGVDVDACVEVAAGSLAAWLAL